MVHVVCWWGVSTIVAWVVEFTAVDKLNAPEWVCKILHIVHRWTVSRCFHALYDDEWSSTVVALITVVAAAVVVGTVLILVITVVLETVVNVVVLSVTGV